MKELHTSTILQKLQKVVSKEFCNHAAFQTGFKSRSTSRLIGFEFVHAMILSNDSDTLFTINQKITDLNNGAVLSNPGLAQRINRLSSSNLMLLCLEKTLKSTYEPIRELIGHAVKRILIQDSSCFELHKKLKDEYPGSSGAASSAAMKIDCIYDYTNECILDIDHCKRNKSDAKNGCRIFNYLQPQDLVLRDLGYLVYEELEEIQARQAYFISRIKCSTNIFINKDDTDASDFLDFIKRKLKNISTIDCEAYLGVKKIKVRIVIEKLSDEIVNERLRKARREAQRSRIALSKLKIAFLSYSILITNLPDEAINAEDLMKIYRIRWRIELLFKEWKSQMNIKDFTGYNIHRINCLIYARMCLILIINRLTSFLHLLALESFGRELCTKRAIDMILKLNLVNILLKGDIKKVAGAISRNLHALLKDKRKRKTTLQSSLGDNLCVLMSLA